jgi:hypothetical protein
MKKNISAADWKTRLPGMITKACGISDGLKDYNHINECKEALFGSTAF